MTEVAETVPTFISNEGKVVRKEKPVFVVKIKSLPFGFFEKELLGYFTQFGEVIRVRVSRSKKTGNHKGWAYVAFGSKEVAEIAAETMNGYLMFEHKLTCKVMKEVPKFMLSGPKTLAPPSNRSVARKAALEQNEVKEIDPVQYREQRKKKYVAIQKKLNALGVDYDISAVPSYSFNMSEGKALKDDNVSEKSVESPKKGKKVAAPTQQAKSKPAKTPAPKTQTGKKKKGHK